MRNSGSILGKSQGHKCFSLMDIADSAFIELSLSIRREDELRRWTQNHHTISEAKKPDGPNTPKIVFFTEFGFKKWVLASKMLLKFGILN